MSSKKISIGAKPTSATKVASVDEWVESRALIDAPEKMKRLTIDIPESLHRAIKSQCALRGTKIADEVRELLANKYAKK